MADMVRIEEKGPIAYVGKKDNLGYTRMYYENGEKWSRNDNGSE